MTEVKTRTYELEGRLLEVCDCEVLCPCWIGEDPDGGSCESLNAWVVDKGTVEGVDVSGHIVATINHIPGNVLAGNWRSVVFVDHEATPEQQEALLNVFTGQLGGPVADLTALVGEVVAVERAPITFTVEGGRGTIKIGSGTSPALVADMTSYQGATEKTTTLHDTAFSTIPGSPVYVGKAAKYRRNSSKYGLKDIDLENHNALQGHFRFEAA